MALVSFQGNVGTVRDPQFNADGKARINFSVAENHGRFDRNTNEWVNEGVTWWAVTVFGKQAEALADVLREGDKQRVVVSGRSKTREYDKQDGTKGKQLEIVADHVGIVPNNAATQQTQPGVRQSPPANDPWTTQAPAQSSGTFDEEPPW